MNRVDTIRVTMPLKQKFVVAHGEASEKTNILTILNNRYSGEASTSVQYGPTLETIEKDIIIAADFLASENELSFETLEKIDNLKINSVSRSAIMGMTINYLSGESKRYPWEILSLATPVGIKNSFTIGLGDPADIAKQIAQSELPILKIKMGGDHDRELLDVFKDVAGKELRVDANGGWSCEMAEEMIFELSKLGVKVIEQPTSIDHISEWKAIKGSIENIELILDEGLDTVKDYKKYSEMIDGINIKMEKCGGILEGMKLANAAAKDKKKVMLGCMVESSVGISQSVYMSSLADYYDLDAPLLLEHDIAAGINYNGEKIEFDREIIGGPKLKRDIVEKYASE